MSDQPPVEAYEGLPSPERKAAAEKASRANEFGSSHLPPQNLEAEEALLGAMLMSSEAIRQADDVRVHAETFYRPSHRVIHGVIQDLLQSGESVDELTTINQLRATEIKGEGGKPVNGLAYVGGAAAIMSLVERVPAVANARAYAKEVRAQWVKRQLVERGHAIAGIGYDPTIGPDDAVRAAESELLQIVTSSNTAAQRGDTLDSSASMELWSALYDRRSDPEQYAQDTLSWGSVELDERFGRALRGSIYGIAGWTKHRKTWFASDVGEAFMEQGARGLWACGEMSDSDMVDRWVAMGGHDYTKVQEGKIPMPLIRERVERIKSWLRRTITGRITLSRLRGELSRAKLEGRPFRFMVLDHFGHLRPDPGEGRHGDVEFNAAALVELKALMEEYDCTLLLVIQLKKPERPDKNKHANYLRPPTVGDLKGTSGIEQILATLVFVHRQMDETTGKYAGQLQWLLFPFHRFREQPNRMRCEFTLPDGVGRSAYRIRPDEVRPASEMSTAVVEVQETLSAAFDATVVAPDDDIPF